MKVRDIIKKLRKDGWYLHEQEGSHKHFRHPEKTGKVTVAGHPSDEIKKGTRISIEKQAGWR